MAAFFVRYRLNLSPSGDKTCKTVTSCAKILGTRFEEFLNFSKDKECNMSRRTASRRDVFLGVGAVTSTVLFAPGRASADTVRRPRKNVDDLTPAELETYEHAVRLLQASTRSGAGPTALHPVLRQTVTQDSGRQWHPHHLHAIEARLRAIDPTRTGDVVIPYWDFTKSPSGRDYPSAFERPGSPLSAANLDPVFWSYHAHIDTVWQDWAATRAPLNSRSSAHIVIGPKTVRILARA
jgi:hypothetical protein